MSKGAPAPVGPRVESPLMARVVAMFTTMIKEPCKFVGCVCTRGRMVHIEPHHDLEHGESPQSKPVPSI